MNSFRLPWQRLMSRWFFVLGVLLLCAGLVVVRFFFIKYRYGYSWRESRGLLLVGKSDTAWAGGFDELKYSQIRSGDSKADVVAAIGLPFRSRKSGGEEVWYYTYSYGAARGGFYSYHQRILVFENDRVTERLVAVSDD